MRRCTASSPGSALDPIGREPVPGYRLLERVGVGGAGEVWSAEAPGGLRVALKIVRLSGPLGQREMTNLRILRSIRHPNLLAYFGAWQADGRLIIGMELADRSLWDRLAEARREGLAGIPLSELLDALFETAKVIDFLNEPRHELAGRSDVAIHHRDIKPQNIMLIGQGVKVADFGLSCLDDQHTTAQNLGLTFAYASPETFRNCPGSRSDQYSLGISYCQLRAGRLPFLGPPASVMLGHLSGEPDLSALPEPERTVLGRALAKDPAGRWPDCKSFVRALAHCAAMGAPETIAAATADTPDELSTSRSILIPPLSDSSDASISVPPDSGSSVDRSVYCLGDPSVPSDPIDERSGTPTVVLAESSMVQVPRRTPRTIFVAASLIAACLTVWSLSWKLTSRAADLSERLDLADTHQAGRSQDETPSLRRSSIPETRPAGIPAPPMPHRGSSHRPAPWMASNSNAPAISIDREALKGAATRVLTRFFMIRARLSWELAGYLKRLDDAITADTTSPTMVAGTAVPDRPAPPADVPAREPQLTMPETLRVEAGRSQSIPILIAPKPFDGPVTVHFEGLPSGVWLPDLTIPAGHTRAEAQIRARADVASAMVTVGVVARAGSRKATAQVRLEVRANPAMLQRTRGHTLLACGRPAEAIAAFTKALEVGVSDPLVHSNRAFAYSLLDRHDLAIGDYTEAIRLKPDDPDLRYHRGMAFLNRGDDVPALLDLDTAIRLDPGHARAYSARARIHLKRGDLARAQADSERAARLIQREGTSVGTGSGESRPRTAP